MGEANTEQASGETGGAAALVEEAAKKSGLLWLALPDLPQPRAAWHVWHDGSAYVLTGGDGEQPLPGLPEAGRVTVTVRSKDKGGRLVTFEAACAPVEPGSELWDEVAPLVAKDRLNAASHEGQLERWAEHSWIVRLTPDGAPAEAPGSYDAGYASVRPVPTPATTAGPRPRMFGAKRRRADR
ncbi:hypothetical protein [Actinomadura parmotrematis]|uniref:Pyridoxamine 5'-phosphate oxidase family protein n=1 Tax=Actinomadura parmotrematis TaxID=2864039 RepID=A0ABS7FM87_9ACTN|nr:hypothetical protein [Actinomadura parmotrematis]MBW8481345.1 hypothetical protein [Actinomadura parmotrematis]